MHELAVTARKLASVDQLVRTLYRIAGPGRFLPDWAYSVAFFEDVPVWVLNCVYYMPILIDYPPNPA